MLKRSLSLAVAGIALAALSGSAGALTQTQSFTFGPWTGGQSETIGYNLFNSNVGTLTGVRLELISTSNAVIEVAGVIGNTYSNATATFTLVATGPPAGVPETLTQAIVAGPIAGTEITGDDLIPVAPASATTFTDLPSVDFNLPSPNYQAAGGGVAPGLLTLGISPGSYTGTGAGLTFGGSGNVNGTFELIYTYSVQAPNGMPEPGTWALVFASASVSLVGLRRRRALKK